MLQHIIYIVTFYSTKIERCNTCKEISWIFLFNIVLN